MCTKESVKKIIFSNKIKEAETAKGIENIQRDLNIALFNEILIICKKLKLNFNEVIRLASTKWNFIKFSLVWLVVIAYQLILIT